MVEAVGSGVQARLDVAQALAIGELGEGHAEELVPAGEAAHAVITAVVVYTALEGPVRSILHQLGEEGATLVHRCLLWEGPQDGDERALVQIVSGRNAW